MQVIPTERRQTLLFSATMTKSLNILAENLMDEAFRFAAYEGLRTADRFVLLKFDFHIIFVAAGI